MIRHSLIAVILLFSGLVVGQRSNHFIKQYSQDDGLGNNRVSDIKQDWRGYLWIANYEAGLTLFDGSDFKNFNENDGLTHNRVKCLEFDHQHRLWIGTQGGGITIKSGDQFIDFNESVAQFSSYISCLKHASDSSMWIGTDKGLFHYQEGKLEGLSETTKLPLTQVLSIYEDKRKNIWVSFWDEGLYCLAKKEGGGYFIQHFTSKNGILDNTIMKIADDIGDGFLLGTMKGAQRVEFRDGKGPFFVSLDQNLPQSQVFAIYSDSTHGQWISFGNLGLFHRDINQSGFNQSALNKEGIVYTFFEDREHILWFSIWNQELCKIIETKIQTFGENSGLDTRKPEAISFGTYGLLVAGSKGLYQWKNDQFEYFEEPVTLDDHYTEIHQDENGLLWTCQENLLMLYSSSGWSEFKSFQSLLPSRITSMNTDPKGNFWITGWKSPVVKYDGTAFSIIRNENLPKSQEYVDALTMNDGSIWLASQSEGIYHLEGNEVSRLHEEFANDFVSDIEKSISSTIWVANQGGGLHAIRDSKVIATIDKSFGLDAEVLSVTIDDFGYVWAGSRDGVFVFKENDAIRGELKFVHKITENDGLLSEECLPKQILVDDQSYCWVGTQQGLSRINRSILHSDQKPIYPAVHIQDILIDYKVQSWEKQGLQTDEITGLPENLVLKHDQNLITLEIGRYSSREENNVPYTYRLNGKDDDFGPIISSPSITFHDLDPGSYTIEIAPCDNQGRCSEESVSYSFSILKPFWKTWWFYLIMLALVNGLLYLFIKLRERNLIESQKDLERKVAQRTAEIEQQKKIIEENNRNITDSIKYAKRIQSAMLISEEELKTLFGESFIIHSAKDIVSGDFFFVSQIAGYKIVSVADCTGHGVPGAVMSMLGYSLFNEAIRKKEINDTGAIFDFVASSVIRMLHQIDRDGESKDGMDANIIAYHEDNQELQISGANNDIFIVGEIEPQGDYDIREYEIDGKVIHQIKADKQPLGIGKSHKLEPFQTMKFKVKTGTQIYLMSDGYVDQFGGESIEIQAEGGKKFKVSRFRAMIAAICDEPLEKQKDIFRKTLSDWKGPLEQVDDITLIGIRI